MTCMRSFCGVTTQKENSHVQVDRNRHVSHDSIGNCRSTGRNRCKAHRPSDRHVAYTAGVLDIEAGKQALDKSKNDDVRAFAQRMVGNHTAVNDQAIALIKKLNVTPEDNPTSKALTKSAEAERKKLSGLDGAAFDKAYVDNEVAYHKTVNSALSKTLIPDAQNAELKSLLEKGLKVFEGHLQHAESLAKHLP
jgi:putative membrane protein